MMELSVPLILYFVDGAGVTRGNHVVTLGILVDRVVVEVFPRIR